MTFKLYDKRNPEELEPYFGMHMSAMTEENLFSKAEIAMELAHRDCRIAELEAEIQCANDAASDYRTTVNVLAESLGVEYEPHQTYTDRIYDAIQRLQKDRLTPECLPLSHEGCDAFWDYWREVGDTDKHGYYESTWGAIKAYLRQAIDNARGEEG